MESGDKKRIGRIGEEAVANHLKRKGFEIIEMNYLRKWGEIDIVARKDKIVHFVEVKTVSRGKSFFGTHKVPHGTGIYRPEENVHREKLKRLHRAIQTWIADNDWDGDWQIDVAAVHIDVETRKGSVTIIENVILEQ